MSLSSTISLYSDRSDGSDSSDHSDCSDVTGYNERGGAACKHAGGAPSGRLSVTACPRLAGGAVTDGAGVSDGGRSEPLS